MSNKVPDNVSKSIKELVYEEADKEGYLSRSRTDNGKFLARLVATPNVGGKLSQYMKRAEIRTYIKDAILNRYSKDKRQEERPNDLSEIIKQCKAYEALLIDNESDSNVSLYKSPSDSCFIVVSDGTVLKWETALRKALLYIASKPFSRNSNATISIILTLFAGYKKVPSSDLHQLEQALTMCNATPYIYGEG